jgi:glycosyltransferase involved in cell wall biosynthesis
VMERVRVSYIVPGLAMGGAEHQLVRLVNGLHRDGFEPAVVCLTPDARRDRTLLRELAPDVRVRALSVGPEGRLKPLRRVVRILLLAQELARWRPHIVHGYLPGGYVMGALAGLLARVPLIIANRMTVSPIHEYRGPSLRFIAGPVNHAIDFHVCDSEAARDVMISTERVDAARTAVIHSATALPDPSRSGVAVPAEWGLGDPGLTAVSLANLRWQKGHGVLIAAVKKVVELHPRFRLVLIGEGPERSRIEALIGDLGLSGNVVLAGGVGKAAGLLAAFHFSVLASVEESLPNALIESMAAAVPVVATKVGGVSEVVRDGVDGLLVPPGEPAALADAMLRLLAEPDLRNRMGASARRRAATCFSLERMVRQTEALYLQLLQDRRGRAEVWASRPIAQDRASGD